MRLVAIDFESFFDTKNGYTLSKMGPIEYIRDPRFAVQMMAWHDGEGGSTVFGDEIPEKLKELEIESPDVVTFAHNGAGFDFLILNEVYGIRPAHPIDTIPMAAWCGITRIGPASHKAVTACLGNGEKLAGTVISDGKRWPVDFTEDEQAAFAFYASQDAAQCMANAKDMLPFMTPDAMKFIEMTSRMACEPVLELDRDMLLAYREELKAKTAKAREDLGKLFRFPDDESFLKAVRSKPAFCKMLEILGREAPMKLSEKKTKTKLEALRLTGHDNPAPEEYEVWEPALAKTDLDFRAMESDPDERVALLVRTRLENNSSMQASRTERFLALADGRPMPVMLQAFKAHTSRYTAGNEGKSDGLQMQNLSKRDPSLLTLRRAIKAPEGFSLVACDSSQVEARILAYVSDNRPLLDAFRTGADPYADLAEKIFGVPSKEIHDGAKGGDKKLKTYRNTGKTAILSCLAGDTEVLTDTGWKPIVMVSETDKLWDGEQWVEHQGLICNGERSTIVVDGTRMTPDHLIWNGSSWIMAGECAETRSCLNRALSTGGASLKTPLSTKKESSATSAAAKPVETAGGFPATRCRAFRKAAAFTVRRVTRIISSISRRAIQTMNPARALANLLLSGRRGVRCPARNALSAWCLCGVRAVRSLTGFCSAICTVARQPDAIRVQSGRLLAAMSRSILPMPTYVLIPSTAGVCSTGLPPASRGAAIRNAGSTPTTADGASSACSLPAGNILHTLCRLTAGTIRTLTSTASTTTETTSRAISALRQKRRTSATGVSCASSRKRLNFSEPVYDLLNAGPNHRFTVRTRHGALIVHNCGYGVGWRKYADTLLRQGVRLNPDLNVHYEMAKHAHSVYRLDNAPIVAFWKYCGQVIEHMAGGGEGFFGGPSGRLFRYGHMSMASMKYMAVPSILGPNGFILRYPGLRAKEREDGFPEWVYDRYAGTRRAEARVYGASLTENLCQYLAFALLMWQACRMKEKGVRIIANIHDSFLAVCPAGMEQDTERTMLECMTSVPDWLEGFPVGAEAEIGKDFTIA